MALKLAIIICIAVVIWNQAIAEPEPEPEADAMAKAVASTGELEKKALLDAQAKVQPPSVTYKPPLTYPPRKSTTKRPVRVRSRPYYDHQYPAR